MNEAAQQFSGLATTRTCEALGAASLVTLPHPPSPFSLHDWIPSGTSPWRRIPGREHPCWAQVSCSATWQLWMKGALGLDKVSAQYVEAAQASDKALGTVWTPLLPSQRLGPHSIRSFCSHIWI